MGPKDLYQLSPQWIRPNDPSLVLSVSNLFKPRDLGLHVLFGPNNVGKTRLLRSLASGVFECEIPTVLLREHNAEIQRFPGAEERDRWGKLPSVIVEWGRRAKMPVLSNQSTDAVKNIVLSGRPNTNASDLSALISRHLIVRSSRGARLVGTNRFLPGAVSISGNKFRSNPNDSSTPGGPGDVSSAIADLHDSPEVSDRACFERLKESFVRIVGVSIAVRRVGMQSILHVVQGNDSRSLEESGDGLRDLLGLLFHLECYEADDLFIDDPGTRLHPGAQRRLLAVLDEAANARAIWIATHDAVFVAAPNAVARYSVSRISNTTHVSAVEELEDARTAIRELGWLPADAFLADTLVCCEGPSDRVVFADRIRSRGLARHSGVVITDLGGSGKVWGADRAELVRLARVARSSVAHGRVVALLDRDEHGESEIHRLTRQLNEIGIGVAFLAGDELEDYWIGSPALLHSITEGLAEDASVKTRSQVIGPTLDEVRLSLAKAGDRKSSDRITDLCEQVSLRWSKELAARLAMARVDELAPEVAERMSKDLDSAIEAAEPKGGHPLADP